jgi:hypothetical protein
MSGEYTTGLSLAVTLRRSSGMTDRIRQGDIVDIHWNDGECALNAEVVWVPSGPGDLWTFKQENGSVIAVNGNSVNFDYIEKKKQEPSDA